MNAPALSRRSFTKGLGAGIVLAFSLDPVELLAQAAAQPPRLPGSLQTNRMLDAWIRINADGTATVFTGKVELGQGILTALCADRGGRARPAARPRHSSDRRHRALAERDLHLRQPVDREQRHGAAHGGRRGASILIDLAAEKLGVAADTLKVENGVISAADGRKIGYGELAAGADLKREATAQVKPKDPASHKIVGQSVQRIDIPDKVFGGAAYVQDMRPAGLVHGRVVRPPRYGSTLESVDEGAVKSMPGVLAVVRDGSFLGVIAQREEQAIKARDALVKSAKWKAGPELPDPAQDLRVSQVARRRRPRWSTRRRAWCWRVPASMRRPTPSHTCRTARSGPSCALAEFKDGQITVWSHGQGMYPMRDDIAKGLKVPPSQVRCVHVEGSGCYGHNGADDAALDAALLARARARPAGPRAMDARRRVRLVALWLRHGDEDQGRPRQRGPHRRLGLRAVEQHPQHAAERSGRQQPAGQLVSRRAAEARHAARGADPVRRRRRPQRGAALRLPEPAVTNHLVAEMPMRVSALRTLGAYANVLASESFMDELAIAGRSRSGGVPARAHEGAARPRGDREGRRRWPTGSRARREVSPAAAASHLPSTRTSPVTSPVSPTSRSTVRPARSACPHIWAAADSGLIINPDGLKNQIEGGVIQSASWTLYEQVRFDKNGINSRDWASYPIMTMPDVPKVTVELINRPNERPLGAGEGSQGPAVAAVANAVAHATGKRLRDLPLDAGKVKAAIG